MSDTPPKDENIGGASFTLSGGVRGGCCEKARPLSRYCVCYRAYECPEHGERHIGSHD